MSELMPDIEPWGDETAEPREWLPADEPRDLSDPPEEEDTCPMCGRVRGHGRDCAACEAVREDSHCPGCDAVWLNVLAPCPGCGMTIEDVAERVAAQRRKHEDG